MSILKPVSLAASLAFWPTPHKTGVLLEENIEKMGRPNAAEEIAEEVMMLADAYIEKETRRRKENLK